LYTKPPRALISARRFYNCATLDRLPIEDEGGSGSRGSHWEKLYMLEAVIGASGGPVFMEHSLALFEDTGWYRANYHKGGISAYGFGAGCGFITTRDCGPGGWGKAGSGIPSSLSPGPEHWPTYNDATGATAPAAAGLDRLCAWDLKSVRAVSTPNWVYKLNSEKCNSAATSAAQFNKGCKVPPWEVHYPAGTKAFLGYYPSNPDKFMNKCPVIVGNSPCTTGIETAWVGKIRGSSKGASSRCFVGSLQLDGQPLQSSRTFYPYKNAACYQHKCTSTQLQIVVMNAGSPVTVSCPVLGGDVSVSGFKGKLTCPPFAELCTLEAKLAAATANLKSSTALRFKGLIPVRGRSGSVVTVTARGLDATVAVYVGGKPTDTCTGGTACLAVKLQGDAQANKASCTAAGLSCIYKKGVRIDSGDKELGHFVVPPAVANGPVDVTLKAANAQVDVGFSALLIDSTGPTNFIDDAKTRKLGATALSGSSNELTKGPTHHMAYYWLPRDTAPFKAGTDDDLFYAVYLYYPADDKVEESATYSIKTVSTQTCRAVASDATEKAKSDCSLKPLSACTGNCVVATVESVDLTVDSSKHPAGSVWSSFQLLVNEGDVPSRRKHLDIIPSISQVVQSGSLTHQYVDCRGQVVGIQAIGKVVTKLDDCGVCGGKNWASPPFGVTANRPLLCDITKAGCICERSWTITRSGCTGKTFSGCSNFNMATGEPCNGFFSDKTPAQWKAEGYTWCKVPSNCAGAAGKLTSSATGAVTRFDKCKPQPVTDCKGKILANPLLGGGSVTDVCGVCEGDGTSCGKSLSGCQCKDSWTSNLGGCSGKTFKSCNLHTPGSVEPCNKVFDTSTKEFASKRPGQLFCEVPADCQGSKINVGSIKLDYCKFPSTSFKSCDASAAPANGGKGDCTSSLGPGATCQPTCNQGYTVSGKTACSAGTLVPATCAIPTCTDKKKNGDETMVDCGGSCPKCPTSCSDKVQNGDETGVDCGGSCPACMVGDITQSGCTCETKWSIGFSGCKGKTFSGCNNYDITTGLPCSGFYSNKSPAQWVAEGMSWCAVPSTCKGALR
jgi:hypothetical protein